MRNPRIVFCTTCKGRTQHLRETLPQNIRDNRDYPNCKFVILDYCDEGELFSYLSQNHREDDEAGRLAVYWYDGGHEFRMAHAKNMAHRCGILEGADILVNLDADNFTKPGFATYIAERFAEAKEESFLWAKWNQTGSTGARIPKGCGGRIIVSRNAFWKAGGYDEKYDTWSPDDKDFHHRLRRLGLSPIQIDGQYLDAVLHNDRMRFREYPHAKISMDSGAFEMVHQTDATIANFGNVGCGTVHRVLLWARILSSRSEGLDLGAFSDSIRIELKPIPTRIFGIGMHKTATTSLRDALRTLGYDAAHWENAHWAKRIWEEVMTSVGVENGHSSTLERHYALSDLPVTILYRYLDVMYPGSKFILTTRDEESWIKSVERHWSLEHNPFRGQWDSDPFTNRLHTLVYGRKKFDREVMLARYRHHNAEVREYFKGRSDDLLCLDMTNGGNWGGLCTFLDRPVPNVPYPRLNGSGG